MVKRICVLAVLFVFAFSVRLLYINKGPFHYDTLDLAQCAQKTLTTGILHYEHGTGFPLTVLVAGFFIFLLKIFGATDPVFCVNVMSVFFGALGVLLLFFVVEKLLDFRRAMFASILLACFAPHVAISTFGKSLTLSICLALASALFMLRYTSLRRMSDLFFAAFFLGFCVAARLSDALVVLPLAYLFFSAEGVTNRSLKTFAVFSGAAFLSAGLYYVPLLMDKGLSPFAGVLAKHEQSAFLGIFSPAAQASWQWLAQSLTAEGLILVCAGLSYMLLKRELRSFLFLVAWFLVFQLFYGSVSSTGVRYLVIAWLPLVVAQGSFLGNFFGRRFYLSCCLTAILCLTSFLMYAPVLEFRHRHALQSDFGRWVARKTEPDSVVLALDESIFIEHYAKRKTLKRPITCRREEVLDFFKDELDPLLDEGRGVYVISTAFAAYDECGIFKQGLFSRYRLTALGSRINEDWHHALLNRTLIIERLYKIEKRKQ